MGDFRCCCCCCCFVVLQVMKCQNNLPLLELTQGLNPLDLFWSKNPSGSGLIFILVTCVCVCVYRESHGLVVSPPSESDFQSCSFFFFFLVFFLCHFPVLTKLHTGIQFCLVSIYCRFHLSPGGSSSCMCR